MRSLRSLLLTAFAVLTMGHTAAAQQVRNVEFDRKATFFSYFATGYVTWPNAIGNSFNIGVVGEDPFGARLTKIQRYIKKKVVVQRFATVKELKQNYQPCHILFISRVASAAAPKETSADRLKASIEVTKAGGVLLISDAQTADAAKTLANDGAMISFYSDVRANRIKMFINNFAATGKNLKIRAPLLKLRIVNVVGRNVQAANGP